MGVNDRCDNFLLDLCMYFSHCFAHKLAPFHSTLIRILAFIHENGARLAELYIAPSAKIDL